MWLFPSVHLHWFITVQFVVYYYFYFSSFFFWYFLTRWNNNRDKLKLWENKYTISCMYVACFCCIVPISAIFINITIKRKFLLLFESCLWFMTFDDFWQFMLTFAIWVWWFFDDYYFWYGVWLFFFFILKIRKFELHYNY